MDTSASGLSAKILPLRPEPHTPMGTLVDSPLAGRFCAWRGASDRRYVTSIYPVVRLADDAGLPDFQEFVLIGVARGPFGRRIVSAATIERDADRGAAMATSLAHGAVEWHVHLLAAARASRTAMVADIAARHLQPDAAMRCA